MKKKIVLIEDDKILSDTLHGGLTDAGFDVSRAFNGEEGMKLVGTEKPDLILLDILLPGQNGLAIAKGLTDNPATKEIPIIILTVLDQLEPVSKALESGVHEYIVKSDSTIEKIVERVKEKLAGS